MFTPQFFIETIQNTKRGVFNQIVKDPEIQRVANRYLEAQTEFANMLVNNAIDMARYTFDHASACWFAKEQEQASKAPYKVEKEAK